MRSNSLLAGIAVLLLVAAVSAGEKATPDQAKAMLEKAVEFVQSEGDAKAVETFNNPKGAFVDRELYVFCMDSDYRVKAHLDETMRGADVAELVDPEGKPIGKEMIGIAKEGEGSLEYKWKNPVSQKVETKVTFLKKAGGLVCGVGAYK